MKTIEGKMTDGVGRYALVAARFNAFIVDRLVEGAVDALGQHGVSSEDITLAWVPGAFEIPAVCRRLAMTGDFDAVIGLGCVIRGETPHFDYVSGECARGLQQLSTSTDCAVIFGVLTCDTIEQATARAGSKAANKGHEAAVSAIEMVALFSQLDGQ
jgi:6,7-dimethyl-8-ribityllumazine synthase